MLSGLTRTPPEHSAQEAIVILRDWQGIFLQMAAKHIGEPEAEEYLRQAKRYGFAADHVERLYNLLKLTAGYMSGGHYEPRCEEEAVLATTILDVLNRDSKSKAISVEAS